MYQSSRKSISSDFKVIVLGSGTSQGVPVIACECEVCQSKDSKDKRFRSSIFIQYESSNIVIDTGPDFRMQMLNANIKQLDAVVFSHEHKDHVAGLDDVRAFNFKDGGKEMEIYATLKVQEALKREYAYIFSDHAYPGIPKVHLNEFDKEPFTIGKIKLIPIDVLHYKLPVKGFRIDNFAYITDANFIAEGEKEKLKGLDVLILNCLRKEKHLSHFNLEEAIELIDELNPGKTYLTHISHYLGKHSKVMANLPSHIELAYDGMVLKL